MSGPIRCIIDNYLCYLVNVCSVGLDAQNSRDFARYLGFAHVTVFRRPLCMVAASYG